MNHKECVTQASRPGVPLDPKAAILTIDGFDLFLTELWWERPPITRAAWTVAVRQVLKMPVTDSSKWWAGDLLHYGERYVVEEIGDPLDLGALIDLALGLVQGPCAYDLKECWTTSRFVYPSRRRAALSFAHHAAVASLGNPERIPSADQVRLLDKAELEGLTVEDLRSEAATAWNAYFERRRQELELHRGPTLG